MSNFYKEMIMASPNFRSKRTINHLWLLEPVTRAAINSLILDADELGIKLLEFETYRSRERQAKLFKAGATHLETVGVHHYGLACDLVRSVNGKPSWKGDFSFLGELAEKHGLIWGGDWGQPGVKHSFVDSVHVQRCALADQAALFAGEWYPDADYNPREGRK